jgi:flagellar hook-associated protein 3 FlgL
MANNDVQRNLRTQESRLNAAKNQIGSQQRIQRLRDDPLAAGHLVRYQSYLTRVEQFEKNAQTLTDQFSFTEGYVDQSVEIMQRVRELAVNGANGLNTQEDLRNMSVEVDELLKEIIQNANAVNSDGNALFAGTSTSMTAFDVDMGTVEGSGNALITGVRYNGTNENNSVEVDEGAYLPVSRSGTRIFWAEPQQLFSQRNAASWQAPEDTMISVDGNEIQLAAGDNVHAVAAKINDAGAAVKASVDPVTGGLNLQTTDARQLWLSDVSGSTLYDLGLIKDASQQPPYNLSDSVRVSGGSLFDTVIALRDAMLAGDTESIGGKVLGSIDSALDNLVTRQAEIGSLYERAQQDISRNSILILLKP